MTNPRPADDDWRRKAEALCRLAEDQRGKPEGELARQKLLEIINNHPDALKFKPVTDLAEKDLTMGDVAWMNRNGVSTEGEWAGRNLKEAIVIMSNDYRRRIKQAKTPKLMAKLAEEREAVSPMPKLRASDD
jgi:hypothetical protein